MALGAVTDSHGTSLYIEYGYDMCENNKWVHKNGFLKYTQNERGDVNKTSDIFGGPPSSDYPKHIDLGQLGSQMNGISPNPNGPNKPQ
jgi:hypothetical protein